LFTVLGQSLSPNKRYRQQEWGTDRCPKGSYR